MLAVISQGDALVIASCVTLVGTVFVAIYAGWRANRTNRAEHAVNTGLNQANSEKLDIILQNQDTIRKDVVFIRSDVQDIRGQIIELRANDHETDARVTKLERHRPEGNDAA